MEHEISNRFLAVIELAITPVILISGVGALMITLTNRMGRVVDRTRILAGQVHAAGPEDRPHLESQLAILWRRAKLVRLSVTLAGISMLLALFLVLAIFVDALLQRAFGVELVIIFVASVLCLIAAVGAFLRDIWLSLRALRLEVDKARGVKAE